MQMCNVTAVFLYVYHQIYETKNIIAAYCIAIGYIDTNWSSAQLSVCLPNYQIRGNYRAEKAAKQDGRKVARRTASNKKLRCTICNGMFKWFLFIQLFVRMHVFCPGFVIMLSKYLLILSSSYLFGCRCLHVNYNVQLKRCKCTKMAL